MQVKLAEYTTEGKCNRPGLDQGFGPGQAEPCQNDSKHHTHEVYHSLVSNQSSAVLPLNSFGDRSF